MNKIVNMVANIPVRSVKPMRYGSYVKDEMSVEDIFKCICGRAIVDEVLKDGTLVRLDLNNYNTDNEPVAATDTVEVEQTKTMSRKEAKAAAKMNLMDKVEVSDDTPTATDAPTEEETVDITDKK